MMTLVLPSILQGYSLNGIANKKKENTLDKILVSWDCDHLPTLEMIDELSQNVVICALFVNCRKSQLV